MATGLHVHQKRTGRCDSSLWYVIQEFQMNLTFQSCSIDGKLRFHALLDVENLHKLVSNHDE